MLKPFDARAMNPAAGYTSTVEDLGQFAAWNFRVLRTEQQEVLKASTLREMQRVQFVNPRMEGHAWIGVQNNPQR